MIAVDTNVLVRYYIDDNAQQHRRARRCIDGNEIFVNAIVLAETFWVLESVYHLPKGQILDVFDHLKRLSNVEFENVTVFARALVAYRDSGCDFADAMLGYCNGFYGFETVTFDRRAMGDLGFKEI